MTYRSTILTRTLAVALTLTPIILLGGVAGFYLSNKWHVDGEKLAMQSKLHGKSGQYNTEKIWWLAYAKLSTSGLDKTANITVATNNANKRIEKLFSEVGGRVTEKPETTIGSFSPPIIRYHLSARGLIRSANIERFLQNLRDLKPYIFVDEMVVIRSDNKNSDSLDIDFVASIYGLYTQQADN